MYRGRIPGSENLSVEDISCKSCLSAEPFIYYDRCAIKYCVIKRGYTGCHECKDFTFASFNAGFRNIVKAQTVCKKHELNENLEHNIRRIAPRVRGWRHEETLGYVEKINAMME